MRKNKDRVIRRTNIPERNVVYALYKGFHRKVYALLGMIIIVMLFKVEFVYGVISVFIFLIYVMIQRRTLALEICEDCIIRYIDADFAEIIYFDEVINYQVLHEGHTYKLMFLLKDGDEYDYIYYDRNITHHLQQLIGDKNATR